MDSVTFDLTQTSLREVNHFLHHDCTHDSKQVKILNPDGAHNLVVGLDSEVKVEVIGHTGYYTASMNKQADVTVFGNSTLR